MKNSYNNIREHRLNARPVEEVVPIVNNVCKERVQFLLFTGFSYVYIFLYTAAEHRFLMR